MNTFTFGRGSPIAEAYAYWPWTLSPLINLITRKHFAVLGGGYEKMEVAVLEATPDYDGYAPAKVVTMGNVIEVTTFEKKPLPPPVRKLTKDLYQNMVTGEVKEYQHITARGQERDSMRKTLARIRALINTNITEPARCRWVTLTYAENMTDPKRLMRDYEKFWKRFKRWSINRGYGVPEYISVVEPQGRGAWHVHAFFIWPRPAPYVDNGSEMARMWGQGFTSTKAVSDDVDNLGAYFSAYLGDIPLDEAQQIPDYKVPEWAEIQEKQIGDGDGHSISKKIIKGGRLNLYPPGMNIIRCSRGIREPETEWTTSKKAKEKASAATLTFSRSYAVLDDSGTIANTVTKDYYNSKRGKSQQ